MTFGEELNIAENRARKLGREEGIGIGNQQGHKEEKESVAMNMLEMNLDTHVIAKATGLSLEEIQKLKKA